MTENEAIKILEIHTYFLISNWKPYPDEKVLDAIRKACASLEEIQQYREIGTIEKFKALKEKSIAKKPIEVDSGVYDYPYDYECPNCRKNVDETDHHCECGQKLDWSEEE